MRSPCKIKSRKQPNSWWPFVNNCVIKLDKHSWNSDSIKQPTQRSRLILNLFVINKHHAPVFDQITLIVLNYFVIRVYSLLHLYWVVLVVINEVIFNYKQKILALCCIQSRPKILQFWCWNLEHLVSIELVPF